MLPPAFVARLEALVPPDRLATVLASFALDKPACVWLNPLRAPRGATLAELAAAFPSARFERLFAARADSAAHDAADDAGAYIARDADVHALARAAAVSEGRAYLINPSSLVPPMVLAPAPGEAVLDLCAAPGGKTLQLAARLAAGAPDVVARGHLAAVEAVKPRFFKLKGILERFGATAALDVRLFLKDGRAVGGAVPERFARILVDAPCSSEARFDADDEASSRHWSERKIAECAWKQRALLRSGLEALAIGGTLVYCTCSFAPEENEDIVAAALAEHGDALALAPVTLPALASPPDFGPDSAPGSTPTLPAIPGRDGIGWRILPDALWDGFYLAALTKKGAILSERSGETRNTSRHAARPARRRHP